MQLGSAPEIESAPSVTDRDGITIRRVQSPDEYAACVAIQTETWGEGFTERVPATILRLAQYVGGVTAGAFASDGRVLGFVFGMTGVRDGRLVHWSDLLAVRPEARDRGLGRRLKLFQRESLRPLGIAEMYWTFDPLVARNAHLNLIRLGARVAEYVPDMYGAETGSAVHGALGTDRFIVRWSIDGAGDDESGLSSIANDAEAGAGVARGTRNITGAGPDYAPVINAPLDGDGIPVDGELVGAPAVRLEVPNDIIALIERNPEVARRWRDTTRRAFLSYLERGYRVAGFQRDPDTGRALYRLVRP
ncbi:MAG: hypothetical protein ACRENI_07655 [Gemmatimonadaceae bacterium]